ncbi:la-related protein 7 [Episyrphus balteatus]|uniref:la-related protein 7 n=1 Tax=Episyrphus balteatus TaxID=286459 RepID=UPI002486225C|nr:la-related protein 7 [Episyrphus balteatus]
MESSKSDKTEKSKNDEDTTSTAPESKDKQNSHKGHRKRKRKFLNAIREQMEFYFGDANLSKDRFLMQLIAQDPFVPIEVFLTFNKLKNLTTSTADIVKSLSNSQLLELDSEQQKVRRKTSLPVDRNVDHKTMYVESLPPTADHEWVKNMFSRFGPIAYVSLPRYSRSKKIKEFGFIEFEEESSVDKAVKAFRQFNGVLCMETSDPAELISVKSFIREQNQEKKDQEERKGKKRRISSESSSQTDSKRSKLDSADEGATSTAAETDDQTDNDGEGSKRRKRKHKKKKKKLNPDEEANPDADFVEIRVLPKKDWKRLRNKYLNMQREKTAELKRMAWKNSQNEMDTTKPVEKPTKKLEKMNMNFYGAGNENDENQAAKFNDRSNDSPKLNPAIEKAPLFSYEPGLIVEAGFLEPCVTLKEFKADMRQYETVKYVDIKEGAMSAFLRLDSAQSAVNLVKQLSCAEYNCKVLSGEVESEYWEKIKEDREAKLNKKVKIPSKRGREKMKKVISKHIRFGDDDVD